MAALTRDIVWFEEVVVAGGTINQITSDPAHQVQLSGLIAATATMLVGGDANAVYAANGIAQE